VDDPLLERHADVGRQRKTDSPPDRAVEILRGRPRAKQYATRTHEELLGDFNAVTDRLCTVMAERDALSLKDVEKSSRLTTITWVVSALGFVVLAEACVIGWFATELFNRIGGGR
jgi:hypothetical protein